MNRNTWFEMWYQNQVIDFFFVVVHSYHRYMQNFKDNKGFDYISVAFCGWLSNKINQMELTKERKKREKIFHQKPKYIIDHLSLLIECHRLPEITSLFIRTQLIWIQRLCSGTNEFQFIITSCCCWTFLHDIVIQYWCYILTHSWKFFIGKECLRHIRMCLAPHNIDWLHSHIAYALFATREIPYISACNEKQNDDETVYEWCRIIHLTMRSFIWPASSSVKERRNYRSYFHMSKHLPYKRVSNTNTNG